MTPPSRYACRPDPSVAQRIGWRSTAPTELVSATRAGRWSSSISVAEPGEGNDRHSQVRFRDAKVDVAVWSRLAGQQRVDAPAARDSGGDAGGGQRRQHAEDLVAARLHRPDRTHPPAGFCSGSVRF